MITIGITGGIGSGKSVVSNILRTLDIPVYDSDNRAKWLNDNSKTIKKGLTELFGEGLYDGNELRHDRLAAAIFSSKEMLTLVNGIIHPEVKNDFLSWKNKYDGNICAIESAILYSSGFDSLCDKIIHVDAPVDIRIQRVMARDASSVEAVKKRILSQAKEYKLALSADFTIINAEPHLLIPQVIKLVNEIRGEAYQQGLFF